LRETDKALLVLIFSREELKEWLDVTIALHSRVQALIRGRREKAGVATEKCEGQRKDQRRERRQGQALWRGPVEAVGDAGEKYR
jgi:hypothetical protein